MSDDVNRLKIELDRLKRKAERADRAERRLQSVLQDLSVHQEELRSQNEELRAAQKELERSHAQYVDLFDTAPVGYVIVDHQGMVVRCNLTMAEMLGRPRSKIVGKPFSLFVASSGTPKLFQHIGDVLCQGRAADTAELTRVDGGTFNAHLIGALAVVDHDAENGPEARIRISVTDVTRQKEAEDKLQASERLLGQVIQNTLVGIWVTDAELVVQVWNGVLERLTGLQANRAVGRRLVDILAPAAGSDMEAECRRVIESGRSLVLDEYPLRDSLLGEGLHYLDVKLSPLLDADQRVTGLVGAVEDVTERKYAASALTESEHKYRRVVNSSPLGIMVFDTEGRILEVNPKALDILGSPSVEMTKSINILQFPPLIESGFTEDYQKCLADGAPLVADRPYTSRWGKQSHLRYHLVPIRDQEGELLGVQCMAEDFSVLKKAQDALKESEERLGRILANIPVLVFQLLVGTDGRVRFTYVSPGLSEMIGLPSRQALDDITSVLALNSDTERRRLLDALKAATRDLTPLELLYQQGATDGRSRWLQTRAVPYAQPDGDVLFYGVAIDVTDQIEARDEALRLAAAVNQAAEHIVITDVEGGIEYVNPSFVRTTGHQKSDVLGLPVDRLFQDRDDGEAVEGMVAALRAGRAWSGRLTDRKKNGETYELEITLSPVHDADGQLAHFVSVGRDVSREATLERRLRQAQKMEALGTLAGGIAHDFNNILAAMIGYTELTVSDLPQDAPAAGFLNQVLKAGQRAKALVNQILSFSRMAPADSHPIDLKSVLDDAVSLIRATLPANIDIHYRDVLGPGQVMAAPEQVHQIVMNLCGNASDAMRESGGRLDITLDRITIEPEAYATELENLSPGPYARMTVQDTGPGMDQATLDRIFDPFFTTKKTGQGTGMGLSVVHGIVAGHKGIVRAHSRPGQGARFEVLLPLIDVSAAQNLPQPDLPAGGSERILFVDDESALVQIGVQMLKRLGYHVVGLTSSAEALQLFQNDPDRFDLLVTDQTMPDLTGDALAREIFEIRPDLPVIVCSGFNQESESNPMANIRRHLVKPLAADELARSVREELDARTNSSA